MNKDLISRSALKKATKSFTDCDGINPVWQIIDNAAPVEVDKLILIVAKRHGKRKMMLDALIPHGKWVDRNGDTWCSVCRQDANYYDNGHPIKTDYCPNCGAKMDGGAE